MATNPQQLKAAQAYVAQHPHCCALDLLQYELELDDLAALCEIGRAHV